MAVVKSEKKYILGSLMVLKTCYNANRLKFYVQLPSTMKGTYETGYQGRDTSKITDADTPKEAMEKFNKLVEDFKTINSKKRKVIIYQVEIETPTIEDKDRYHYSNDEENVPDRRVNFQWVVCNEINQKHLGMGNKYVREDGSEVRGISDDNVIVWTKEREAFFLGVQNGIDSICENMEKFFNKNKKGLTKRIAESKIKGQLLLPESK